MINRLALQLLCLLSAFASLVCALGLLGFAAWLVLEQRYGAPLASLVLAGASLLVGLVFWVAASKVRRGWRAREPKAVRQSAPTAEWQAVLLPLLSVMALGFSSGRRER